MGFGARPLIIDYTPNLFIELGVLLLCAKFKFHAVPAESGTRCSQRKIVEPADSAHSFSAFFALNLTAIIIAKHLIQLI